MKLITYEEAVEQAKTSPNEVEKSWVLHDFKNSPEIQAVLEEAILEKLADMGWHATRIAALRDALDATRR